MENNSQPPAPAAPAAKVTLPVNEPPKTTQPSSMQPAMRPPKLMIMRRPSPPSPPPPKLPVYRPPPPPRPELPSSSVAGNALLLGVYRPPPPPRPELPNSSTAGNALQSAAGNAQQPICVLNMQADPPSPDQVTTAEEGSDSEGGDGSGDDVQMLDLNFPPVSDNEEN